MVGRPPDWSSQTCALTHTPKKTAFCKDMRKKEKARGNPEEGHCGQRAYEGSMSGIYRKQKGSGQCDQSQLGEGAEKQKKQRKRSTKAFGSCKDIFANRGCVLHTVHSLKLLFR